MKEKICQLCKGIIGKKDNYVRVTDYFQGEFHSEGFYHNKCYLDRINTGANMQKNALTGMALSLLNRTNKLLDKHEGKEEKEVIEI